MGFLGPMLIFGSKKIPISDVMADTIVLPPGGRVGKTQGLLSLRVIGQVR